MRKGSIFLACLDESFVYNRKSSLFHKLFRLWTKELMTYSFITENYEKLVVSLDDFCLPPNEGIRHVRTWELHGLL